MIDVEGNLIQGTFENGLAKGPELNMKLKNGLTYNGAFEEGKIQGKGKMEWQTTDSNVKVLSTFGGFKCNYTGQFKDQCFTTGAL